MPLVCKMADSGRLTVDQKLKAVLFYAETKSVVATQRRFRAHFGTRWAPCKQIIYRLSVGTIFQPMRINSVPDVKWFCNNKNVLCVQSTVWHFVRHPLFLLSSLPAWLLLRDPLTARNIAICDHRCFVPMQSIGLCFRTRNGTITTRFGLLRDGYKQ